MARGPYEVVYSLNYLAGTLSNGIPKYGAAQAAAIWAGISAPFPELVDTLNRKQGNKLPNYLELDGVCNQLAGTKDLTAQDALTRLVNNSAGNQASGQTWATIVGTWAQQTETWANV